MIYCVRFSDVEAELRDRGFRRVGATDENVLFMSGDGLITIRAPNVDGNVPEVLVAGAFDSAGLTPPRWDVFWCD